MSYKNKFINVRRHEKKRVLENYKYVFDIYLFAFNFD